MQDFPLCLQRGHLTINSRPGSACDFHRVTQPFLLADINPSRPVMVFNRLPTFDISSLRLLRNAGVAIVCDMDDHFDLGADHPLSAHYARTGVGAAIEYCVRFADLVIASTPHLADRLRPYNARIEVVPNALPFDTGMWTRSPDIASGSKFVYAGGATHRPDLALIRAAYAPGDLTIVGYEGVHPEWAAIEDEHPHAEFEGVIPLQDWRNLVDRRQWKIAGQPRSPHITIRDIIDEPRTRYMDGYNGHACAIAPLRDSLFNRCKSNLKVLEAGAKGIPIICSPVPPYLNPLDQHEVIYADDWRNAFTLPHSQLYDAGQSLAEHVREHYHMDDANELRRQLIEAL